MSNAQVDVDVRRTLNALSGVPEQIAQIATGCSVVQLHRAPKPDAWSARDIVAHVRACADVWGRSMLRMINEAHPTIRYVSPRSWIRRTDYATRDFRDSLRAYSEGRKRLIGTLATLDTAGWLRGATFTGTTLGREATVLSHAHRMLEHELGHLEQLRRTLQP
jgi:DinB superfamily